MDDPGEARWLDEEQQRIWYAFAYALIRLPATLDAQMQRDAGISQFEYMVLSGLSMAPERTLRMSVLAGYTASTLARLGNVVTRLEKRGWVHRTPDPADGRYTLAVLTEEGMAKVVASAPAHADEVRRIVFDPLTRAQQRQLGVIAQRILKVADPTGPSLDARLPETADTTEP
ncbi:MarR family winged helix-turn-helix transcriptional regulator [Plantactinospora mayteni]|nr:MarR family transcriptional regulator [Plantactinospora mayteni]